MQANIHTEMGVLVGGFFFASFGQLLHKSIHKQLKRIPFWLKNRFFPPAPSALISFISLRCIKKNINVEDSRENYKNFLL